MYKPTDMHPNEFYVRPILGGDEGEASPDGELIIGIATMERAAAEGARSLDELEHGVDPEAYAARDGGERRLLVEDHRGDQARFVVQCRLDARYIARRVNP